MDKMTIKYRTTGKAIPPRPVQMKIPGWSGQAVKKRNGSEPQPWHCPPFVDAATYALELVYPYEKECHIINQGGVVRFAWDYANEPGHKPNGAEFNVFFPHPPRFYFFATGIDLQAPPGHVIRVETHPRFFTDATETAPAAVCGHVQTEWWSKTMFIVFKVPAPGQRHIFRKGEPYAQILSVPHRLPYEAVQMDEAEHSKRESLEKDITLAASHIAKNVWHNPMGQEFKNHYKVMSRAFAREGHEGVEEVVKGAVERKLQTQPANKSVAECMALARERQLAGRYIEARDLLFFVLDREPQNAEATGALGRLAAEMNLKDLAQNMMARAISLQAQSPVYRRDLGGLLLSMNKFPEAEACLRTVLQLDPKDPIAMAKIGDSLAKRGRTEEARACYRGALAIDANCAEAQAGLDQLLPKLQ